jgi:hypothetical protein
MGRNEDVTWRVVEVRNEGWREEMRVKEEVRREEKKGTG